MMRFEIMNSRENAEIQEMFARSINFVKLTQIVHARWSCELFKFKLSS